MVRDAVRFDFEYIPGAAHRNFLAEEGCDGGETVITSA